MAVTAYTTPARVVGIDGVTTVSVNLTFRFYDDDPIAFRMLYNASNHNDEVEWHAALDLLREGLEHPAGLADVQIWPEGRKKIAIRMESEAGTSVTRVPRTAVEAFLTLVKEEEKMPSIKSGKTIEAAVEKFLVGMGMASATAPRISSFGVPNPGGPSQPQGMCNVCGRVHSGNGCGDF